ncbi:hypothetical protein PAXRUDRAFT_824707 [Paxillus rubicundulus Ve08.2h10]|uniref:RBR-type E3 ubiquitin transferase n=1 Tax=Paxillus rubicundulus Ve08.2h10 TaxID=930991 RepID=A0A0D0EBI0_9AGAM|nr:hypothetical protein PAXRUDRAFT_824707 [Paxillus rubicundulus Ve08.2h10]
MSEIPSDADSVTCRAMQIEEWQVLEVSFLRHRDDTANPLHTSQSIHPTICISNDTSNSQSLIKLEIPIELGERRIAITPVPPEAYYAAPEPPPSAPESPCQPLPSNEHQYTPSPDVLDPLLASESAVLSALPPLHLHISLPASYPLHALPTIQSLQAASGWLPQWVLGDMKQRMSEMCNAPEGSGVLYSWVEWIRSGEFLADVGIFDQGSQSIRIPHPHPPHLLSILLAYASSSKSDIFAHTSHSCSICLYERKGVHCLALQCGHVFCRECLAEMWGLHVKEGEIARVGCPEVDCGKEEGEGETNGLRETVEEEVRAVLSENEVKRWRWLRKKRDFERDPTMIHCPMEFCQEPVPKPKPEKSKNGTRGDPEEDDSGWARLRTCGSCGYSFCAFCRRTWHGPLTPCPLPLTSKFLLDYLTAPPGSPERLAIERRYGRSNVLKLLRRHEEEQENRKWMDASTMACPGCEVRVEKSMGCNHVSSPSPWFRAMFRGCPSWVRLMMPNGP